MPLYEVLLEDWNEIRLSSEPLHVGNVVEIENTDWFVFGVAKTLGHSLRYLCVRRDAEAVRAEARARRKRAREAVDRASPSECELNDCVGTRATDRRRSRNRQKRTMPS